MVKKAFSLLLFLFFFINNSHAQGKIVANIHDLKNNVGTCIACLYNNAAAFNGEQSQPIKCFTASIRHFATQIVFTNIDEGEYAIKVFHDENNNKKIDRNFLGIPKEGYGASLNKLRFAAAPTYHDNIFLLHNDSTKVLRIKLRYL